MYLFLKLVVKLKIWKILGILVLLYYNDFNEDFEYYIKVFVLNFIVIFMDKFFF